MGAARARSGSDLRASTMPWASDSGTEVDYSSFTGLACKASPAAHVEINRKNQHTSRVQVRGIRNSCDGSKIERIWGKVIADGCLSPPTLVTVAKANASDEYDSRSMTASPPAAIFHPCKTRRAF
jgi:hypothetical protein